MPPSTNKQARKPLTVLLDTELQQCLNAERARIGEETGLHVSMNQVATRAMRAGFREAEKR